MNAPNAISSQAAAQLSLGGFVLKLAAGELLTPDGELAGLRKQSLQVLLLLGERAGEVISKDELMNAVWPDVVVGEGSLTQTIADIRRVLGDAEHRLVRNVARRGYMLVPDETANEAPPLSIAVLPFMVEGAAADRTESDEWLADALRGDLIAELTRMQDSLVVSRETTASYKARDTDPRHVARELCVCHIVRGSLRHEGSAMRLSLALINGENGIQHWSETFMIDRSQLPQTLADLAVRLTRALMPEVFRATVERRAALSTLEVTADDLAMQANSLWFRGFTAANFREALSLYDRAIALDANNMRAWAGIAPTIGHAFLNDWMTDRAEVQHRIEEAAQRMMAVDPERMQTFVARSLSFFLREDWSSLLRLVDAFVARHHHPNAFGARGMVLIVTGDADGAVAALETALHLSARDPIRSEWQYRLAMAHFMATRYDLASDWSQTAELANPNLPWPPIHAAAMHMLGDGIGAQRAVEQHVERHPTFSISHIVRRLPGDNPRLVEARDRLIAILTQLGLR
jgi:DNA-binding winged helix-turn-helix (wHTH) protein